MAETAVNRTGTSGGHRPGSMSSRGTRELSPDKLVWPSGRGDEVGVVSCSIAKLLRTLMKNGNGDEFDDVIAMKVEEEDARAVVLSGLLPGPVSFFTEPGMPTGRLAIVADSAADLALLAGKLRILLKGLKFEI